MKAPPARCSFSLQAPRGWSVAPGTAAMVVAAQTNRGAMALSLCPQRSARYPAGRSGGCSEAVLQMTRTATAQAEAERAYPRSNACRRARSGAAQYATSLDMARARSGTARARFSSARPSAPCPGEPAKSLSRSLVVPAAFAASGASCAMAAGVGAARTSPSMTRLAPMAERMRRMSSLWELT